MEANAKLKFIRMSPRKIRLVADIVRGMEASKAMEYLRLMKKAAASPVAKLINSAIANAENNFELSKDNLYIKEITVDEAPTLKRSMPRAHGRATTIRKRNSHVNVILAEIKDTGKKEGKKPIAEKPIKLSELNKKEIKQDQPAKKSKVEVGEDTFDKAEEQVKEVKDPRMEGRRGHTPVEGGRKGFVSKIFRRKSG